MTKLRVLFVCHECNPGWSSVPLIGYRIFEQLSRQADVTLITHGRNRENLIESKAAETSEIRFIDESLFSSYWFKWVVKPGSLFGRIWALANLLAYPIYREFDRRAYRSAFQDVKSGKFDVIHVFTPVIPRYPSMMRLFAKDVPIIFGPVNGGLSYPSGFKHVARSEFDFFNKLRWLSKMLPGYHDTYSAASKVLCGTQATKQLVLDIHGIQKEKTEVMCENAIYMSDIVGQPVTSPHPQDRLKLITCGRLVPCKGVDMIVEALRGLPERVTLTIVGDGEERPKLEELVKRYGLESRVEFTGWVRQEDTKQYYRDSHVFCFPSVRDFGGAVVLEAMSAGLPSIVVDYGGPAEYVTDQTGYKIYPHSSDQVVKGIKSSIEGLLTDPTLVTAMSKASISRAKDFTWEQKGQDLLSMYQSAITRLKETTS